MPVGRPSRPPPGVRSGAAVHGGLMHVKELCLLHGSHCSHGAAAGELGLCIPPGRPVLRCREIIPAKQEGPLTLNAEQTAAYDVLAGKLEVDRPGVALLHGVTGSGKTAVYLEAHCPVPGAGKGAPAAGAGNCPDPSSSALLAAHFWQGGGSASAASHQESGMTSGSGFGAARPRWW